MCPYSKVTIKRVKVGYLMHVPGVERAMGSGEILTTRWAAKLDRNCRLLLDLY